MLRVAHSDVKAKILRLNRGKWDSLIGKVHGMRGQRPRVQVLLLLLNEFCDLSEVIYAL